MLRIKIFFTDVSINKLVLLVHINTQLYILCLYKPLTELGRHCILVNL